ncbi:hypothetical protein RYX36_034668 [Vicia faba]
MNTTFLGFGFYEMIDRRNEREERSSTFLHGFDIGAGMTSGVDGFVILTGSGGKMEILVKLDFCVWAIGWAINDHIHSGWREIRTE